MPTSCSEAFLGTRVRALIERYADRVSLLTPQSCVNEAREYLPALCAKRGWEVSPALEALEALLTGIQIIENASRAEFAATAKRRIAERDHED